MKSRNVCALLALGLAASAASADLITFDEGGVGPALFMETTALSGPYMATGVVFAGPSVGNGGAILDWLEGGWWVPALSGRNFLGFNDGGYPFGPETITFPTTVSDVKISVSGQENTDPFMLEAFDASNNLVASDTVVTWGWAQLSVAAPGIKKVVLSQIGGGPWTADNLMYTPVPLPTTAAMAVLGAGATMIRRRRIAKAS